MSNPNTPIDEARFEQEWEQALRHLNRAGQSLVAKEAVPADEHESAEGRNPHRALWVR